MGWPDTTVTYVFPVPVPCSHNTTLRIQVVPCSCSLKCLNSLIYKALCISLLYTGLCTWINSARCAYRVAQVRNAQRVLGRGWKQTSIVQFFGTKNHCWGAKWPNVQSNCTQIQIVGVFLLFTIIHRRNRFYQESATHQKIAIIVDQSWSPMTAKSANGVARTSPRRLGHPFFNFNGVPTNIFVFLLFCSPPSPRTGTWPDTWLIVLTRAKKWGATCEKNCTKNFLVSSRTLSPMTPNILFSRPTEIHPEIWRKCYCVVACCFSSINHVVYFLNKQLPARDKPNLNQERGLWYKNILIRKSRTFRQLPTNQDPTNPRMYVCKRI